MFKGKLLTQGNTKTIKGQRRGYMTFILHLSPARLSGFNVCAASTAGCRALCVNITGHGGIADGGNLTYADLYNGHRTNSVQIARLRRTSMFFEERAAFMALLHREIARAIRYARERGYRPVFRLNGTSDIRYESVPVTAEGRTWPNIMSAFKRIQFYDYTKLANRKGIPSNYHLTFSLAENNEPQAFAAISKGMNVAVVWRTAAIMPREFMGMPVFNGDESDLRFLDPRGICGLYAKGPAAKRDTSGFVRD